MEHVNNKGRPWGGLCWFIKKEIEVIKHEIVEEVISLLEIKYNYESLTLMGVYIASTASNIEQQIRFESQLLILSDKIYSCRMENKKFIIIGDCNGDIKRNRYQNDIKLKEFINNLECKSIENINFQIDYTYFKANIKSKIDQIIVDRNYQGIILEIKDKELNTSDHLALVVKVPMGKKRIEMGKKEECVKVLNINWQNVKSVEKYEEILNIKLRNIKFNNIMFENENI